MAKDRISFFNKDSWQKALYKFLLCTFKIYYLLYQTMRYLFKLILITTVFLSHSIYADEVSKNPNGDNSEPEKATLRAYWGEPIPAKLSAYQERIEQSCKDGSHMDCLLLRASNFRKLYKDCLLYTSPSPRD